MRVLLVSQKPNAPTVTGEMVFVENLTRGLEEAGVPVTSLAVGTDFLAGGDVSRLVRYTRIPGIVRSCRSLRLASGFDMVHFLDSSLALSGLYLKGKKIATSHVLARSHYLFRSARGIASKALESAYSAYSNSLDGFSFRRMDMVVAESPFHRGDLLATFGLPQSRVAAIPPGIDTARIRRAAKEDLKARFGVGRIAAYIARLDSPAKGLKDFIDAATMLRGEDVAFLVVGEGSERAHYQRVVRERGLEKRIFFLGALDFDKKTSIQKSADAIVIPSVSETFCMVFAESLALGVPVVAYDLPFWKGLYDGAGVFTDTCSASLAEGIKKALGDGKLRAKVASRGLSLSEKYGVKNTVSAYLQLYEGLEGLL